MTIFINKGCKVGNKICGNNIKFGTLSVTQIIKISHITAGLKQWLLNIMFKVHTSTVLNANITSVISMTEAYKETKAA